MLVLMKELSSGERRVIAEFLSNIGVAWFVAGVINPFVSRPKNWWEIALSFIWGVAFSSGFLKTALSFAKGVKS